MYRNKFLNPITLGAVLSLLIIILPEIGMGNEFLQSAILFWMSFLVVGVLNYKKELSFKGKLKNLFILTLVFFGLRLLHYLLFIGFNVEAFKISIGLALLLFILGFLMNVFLIMKKGHWIAIIVLGFFAMFSMINSFLAKQEANFSKQETEKQMEITLKYKSDIELERKDYEAKIKMLKTKIDSLENQLK